MREQGGGTDKTRTPATERHPITAGDKDTERGDPESGESRWSRHRERNG